MINRLVSYLICCSPFVFLFFFFLFSFFSKPDRYIRRCNVNRTWNLFQGDYIRHPVLYELSSKYGVAGSDQVPLPARLDVLREHIRREIRKVCRVSLYPSWQQLLRSLLPFFHSYTIPSQALRISTIFLFLLFCINPSISGNNESNMIFLLFHFVDVDILFAIYL